jgi:hypothetical protein
LCLQQGLILIIIYALNKKLNNEIKILKQRFVFNKEDLIKDKNNVLIKFEDFFKPFGFIKTL